MIKNSTKKYTTVTFLKDIHLPRFIMKKNETWDVRAERLTAEGFNLGNGFVSKSDYKINLEK